MNLPRWDPELQRWLDSDVVAIAWIDPRVDILRALEAQRHQQAFEERRARLLNHPARHEVVALPTPAPLTEKQKRRLAKKRERYLDPISRLRSWIERESAESLLQEPQSNVEHADRCAYCGTKFEGKSYRGPTKDHIYPRCPPKRERCKRQRKPGSPNTVTVCGRCNKGKGNQLWLSWLLRNKFMRRS